MKLMRVVRFLLGTAVLLVAGTCMLGVQGCQRQTWDTNPEHMLRLSADTLFFDTVFAPVGSVTLPLNLYHDHAANSAANDPAKRAIRASAC